MEEGFLGAVLAMPADDGPRQVYADWLEESGRQREADFQRQPYPPVEWFFASDGDGDTGAGAGYGAGDGYGYGYGAGAGAGAGAGYGYGYGYGDGDGDGDGSLIGVNQILGEGAFMPVVGQNQLIVLPYGWVICGYVAERIGLFQYRVERASVICRTGGVPWDELADGRRRELATFRRWGTVTVGPNFGPSREWVGDLP